MVTMTSDWSHGGQDGLLFAVLPHVGSNTSLHLWSYILVLWQWCGDSQQVVPNA